MPQKIGKTTIKTTQMPSICAYAAVAGKKEGEGPLGKHFDILYKDPNIGQKSFEQAESVMQKDAVNTALKKAGLTLADIDVILAGDLINQCTSSAYAARGSDTGFLGLYGACSTMAQSIALAALLVDSGALTKAMAVTSSHFCAAERQFRYPLEYGGNITPTSQWTVTGSGAALVGISGEPPFIKAVTIGKVQDLGVKDVNNMGAAMAPAAYDTIKTYLRDTGSEPRDYDLILTGDLGKVGSLLLIELLSKDNIDISGNHKDCGMMIFDIENQDVHSGGSGCGCSAVVLCSLILSNIRQSVWKNVLFAATGALMSPMSVQQGETIPAISHLIHFTN
ncbi:MAG: stage V sporulation protein AD [Oscillospiraceae bacterium]|nr:stage V sporulation protein AD [Oscillospiraceae bacterium]